jgi:hypothetical protein
MSENLHTPTPWEVVRHRHSDDQLWLSINQCADAEGMKRWIAEIKYRSDDDAQLWADAEFIVRACNAHEALVAVLKMCLPSQCQAMHHASPNYRHGEPCGRCAFCVGSAALTLAEPPA